MGKLLLSATAIFLLLSLTLVVSAGPVVESLSSKPTEILFSFGDLSYSIPGGNWSDQNFSVGWIPEVCGQKAVSLTREVECPPHVPIASDEATNAHLVLHEWFVVDMFESDESKLGFDSKTTRWFSKEIAESFSIHVPNSLTIPTRYLGRSRYVLCGLAMMIAVLRFVDRLEYWFSETILWAFRRGRN